MNTFPPTSAMDATAPPLRETIKSTARRLFAAEGYDQITIERILEELALPRTRFLTLFLSKDELLEALWSE